ncbi:PPI1 [Scenedesmus sp. PABB004]|nr:PPI1 [Scenedesmus sp. PABB004]
MAEVAESNGTLPLAGDGPAAGELEAGAPEGAPEAVQQQQPEPPRGLYILRIPRPTFDDSAIKKLETDLSACFTKLKAINGKAQIKRGEANELRKQLGVARSLRNGSSPEFDEKMGRLKGLREMRKGILDRLGDMRAGRQGLEVRTEEELDERVAEMEHAIQHDALPLTTEKQYVRNIAKLKAQREKIREVQGQQESVGQLEAEAKKIKAVIDEVDSELNILRGERDQAKDIINDLQGKLQAVMAVLADYDAERTEIEATKRELQDRIKGMREEIDAHMFEWRANRKLSLQLRDLVAEGKTEEATAIAEQQIESYLAKLSEPGYRKEYTKAWAEQRRYLVSELLPESGAAELRAAAGAKPGGAKGGPGGRPAAPLVPQGAAKAQAIIAAALLEADVAIAAKRAAEPAAAPAPEEESESGEADEAAGEDGAPAAPAQPAVRIVPGATDELAAPPKARSHAKPAFHHAKAMAEVPEVPDYEYIMPPPKAKEGEELSAAEVKARVREEQRAKAAEAEARKKRRAEQLARKAAAAAAKAQAERQQAAAAPAPAAASRVAALAAEDAELAGASGTDGEADDAAAAAAQQHAATSAAARPQQRGKGKQQHGGGGGGAVKKPLLKKPAKVAKKWHQQYAVELASGGFVLLLLLLIIVWLTGPKAAAAAAPAVRSSSGCAGCRAITVLAALSFIEAASPAPWAAGRQQRPRDARASPGMLLRAAAGSSAAPAGARRAAPLPPRAAGGGPGTARPPPVLHALTSRIKHAGSVAELACLHAAHRGEWDDVALSAFLGRLAHIAGDAGRRRWGRAAEQQELQQEQEQEQEQQQQEQSWGPAAAARQRLSDQLAGSPGGQQQLVAALREDLQALAPRMRPRALSATLWALARLAPAAPPPRRLVAALLARARHGLGFAAFEPRQLCLIAFALTQLQPPGDGDGGDGGGGGGDAWEAQHGDVAGEAQGAAPPQQRRARPRWDGALLDELFCALGEGLPACGAQDAAQAVLCLARLRHAPPRGWLAAWLARATALLPRFSGQGLANAAYGLARAVELSGTPPQQQGGGGGGGATEAGAARAWLQGAVRVAALHLPALQPRELLGQLLLACGRLGAELPQPAAAHVLARARGMLRECDAQHLALALYVFALLRAAPPPDWVSAYWRALWAAAGGLQPLDLCQLLWAARRLALPLPRPLARRLQRRLLATAGGARAGQLVSALHSCAGLGLRLPPRFLARMQGALLARLPEFGPRDHAGLLVALAAARAAPDAAWLDRVLAAAAPQLAAFSPAQLGAAAGAVAALAHAPARPWLAQLLRASLPRLAAMDACQLTRLAWALSRWQCVPSPLWRASFWEASRARLGAATPPQLAALAAALAALRLAPPPAWLAALAAVEGAIGGFSSGQLLGTLRALAALQARGAAQAALAAAAPSGGARRALPLPGAVLIAGGSSGGGRALRAPGAHLTPGQQVEAMFAAGGPHARCSLPAGAVRALRLQRQQAPSLTLPGALGVPGAAAATQPPGAVAAEAYGIACLVVLMPDWLQHRVAHWPRELAAERAALPAR